MAFSIPVALGSANNSGVASVTITTSANTASGSLIFVAVYVDSGPGPLVVTDSASNTYTDISADSSGPILRTAYAKNCISLPIGGTIKCAIGSKQAIRAVAISCAGADSTAPLDVVGTFSSGTGTSATTVATGTLANAAELVLGAVVVSGNTSTVSASGFTALINSNAASSSAAVLYDLPAGTGSVSWSPTWTGSNAYVSNVFSFIPLSASTKPLLNSDQPNPRLSLNRRASAIRAPGETWNNLLTNNLAGRDTFFAGQGDAPDYHWPNPTRTRYPNVFLGQSTASRNIVVPTILSITGTVGMTGSVSKTTHQGFSVTGQVSLVGSVPRIRPPRWTTETDDFTEIWDSQD